MSGAGLDAFHKIKNNINDQDERIWRQTAAKKCLKKEIEKLEEQSKRYEMDIATLKKDPLYEKKDNATKSLEDNMKEHLQTYKLLSLTLNAKREEIERKTKDLESWDKKYKEVIDELKEAHDIKKSFCESANPMYKKLVEINTAQKLAEVMLKQLKASLDRRQKSQKQLEIIKEDIIRTTIVNFAKALTREKKYDEVSGKLKALEEKKKEMVLQMFEAQEALKKLRVSHTTIPSGMFTRKIANMNMQPPIRNKIQKRSLPAEFLPEFNKLKKLNMDQTEVNQVEKNKGSENSSLEEENIPPSAVTTHKKIQLPSTNRINILSNKTVALPPLKTILTKQRSRLDTSNRSFGDISFNKSQNTPVCSQSESTKKIDSTPRASQESQGLTQKSQNSQKTTIEPNITITKPSDYLKNLKFTTQSNKFESLQQKLSSANIQNNLKNQTQKTSILKAPMPKRTFNESIQEADLDTSQRKKEKNVNFASPIQQQMELNEVLSPEGPSLLSSPMSLPSNRDMNASIEGNMWASNENEFQIGAPNFSFAPSGDMQSDKSGSNIPQASMFGGTNEADNSFGFMFGGSSKATGGLWDLFG